MNWQWIEDFIIAASIEAVSRRGTFSLSGNQAARLKWAAVFPMGEA